MTNSLSALFRLSNAVLPARRMVGSALLVFLAATLSACGDTEKAPGQSLARVNGEDITILQLNDELQRTGDQQTFTKKQVLEGLIDRQLLVTAAQSEKLERDPLVMQAIERDKAQILAQAYLQRKIANNGRPSALDIDSFYQKNPDLFSLRKQFELKELVIDTKNLSPELTALMGTAKSLNEVASWLDSKKIAFAPTHVTRTSVDLPNDVVKAMKSMSKGQLFTLKEGQRSILIAIEDIKDTPVTGPAASAQIERFLINQKNKEAEIAEIARLHMGAKIAYLNDGLINKDVTAPAAAAAAAAAAPVPKADAAGNIARGVAGLK